METLFYLVLAAVLYGILADRTDRAVDREMRKRREQPGDLQLVEDDVAGLDVRPRDGWFVRRRLGLRARGREAPKASTQRAR